MFTFSYPAILYKLKMVTGGHNKMVALELQVHGKKCVTIIVTYYFIFSEIGDLSTYKKEK